MIAVETLSFAGQAELAPEPEKSPLVLVVATDGSDAATAAFTAARLIAEKRVARIHVISVVEPVPLILPMTDVLAVPPEVEERRIEGMRELVERQRRAVDPDSRWTVEIRIGTPAVAISQFAREAGADFVIVGLHKHGMIGRMLGEETAMEIARSIDVPLLVASPGMERLPRRVMVAMGIEPTGLPNLTEAITAIADTPSVSCVHVKPLSESLGIDWADIDPEYEFAMEERFADVEGRLAKAGLNAELFVRNGDTTRELAEYARYSQAELVIVGIRAHRGFLVRTGGRLAARMLRHLNTSILIIPERLAPVATTSHGTTQVLSSSAHWNGAMKGFTARNVGRISTLEVDEPSMGALIEARSYPLLGVDYDHRDERLVIMLGEMKGTARHISRSILKPESVSILTVDGRDTALSVKHGAGQTLLTFS